AVCSTNNGTRDADARLGTVPPKPLSQARIALRCFCEEIVPACFAAETQAPMLVGNKTQLSPAVRAAVLQLGHDAHAPPFQVGPAVHGDYVCAAAPLKLFCVANLLRVGAKLQGREITA